MQICPAILRLFSAISRALMLGVLHEGAGAGQGVAAAAADGGDPFVGINDVAGTAEQEGLLGVSHDEQGLELAEHFVGSPVLGELDGGATEVSGVLFELGFKAGEE